MKNTESDLPLYLFHRGENFRSYRFFGAHFTLLDGKEGVVFRVWVPKAKSVSVVGSFNGWTPHKHEMKLLPDGETFELFIPNLKEYDDYKYYIETFNRKKLYKADPYAFHSETPGVNSMNSSKIYRLDGYLWKDSEYITNRNNRNVYASPMNIYEVNPASWKHHENGDFYSYNELALSLTKYVKEMGYTHVEFMPVTEYPFIGSWGYQVTGYFSITSRLGTPKDFMALVDSLHEAGIGVILDWVPAHFPKDAFGLYEFNGKELYEPSQWDRKENKGWGTHKFDYGRNEVVSFLVSSADFLFEYFHIDGLRVDAVASMLYLDYDKKDGEWVPNIYGENKNLEAVAFLRKLNEEIFRSYPHALMIAEESTSWPMVTKPTDIGGLGFNFKWNMGWMNDVLSYVKTDPLFRKFEHNKLTFSMMYAFSENYVLPISHDEVVHGKHSLIDKMPGEYLDKFSSVRTFLMYMMAHPGKKLNFMGSEFGQFKEWNYEEGIEFFLKQYPLHQALSDFTRDLNFFYKSNPAFFEVEDSWDGFEWLAADDSDHNFLAFLRRDRSGKEIFVLINFSGADLTDKRLGLPSGKYEVVFSSDVKKYGGAGKLKKKVFTTKKVPSHGKKYSIQFDMPKLSALYLIKNN